MMNKKGAKYEEVKLKKWVLCASLCVQSLFDGGNFKWWVKVGGNLECEIIEVLHFKLIILYTWDEKKSKSGFTSLGVRLSKCICPWYGAVRREQIRNAPWYGIFGPYLVIGSVRLPGQNLKNVLQYVWYTPSGQGDFTSPIATPKRSQWCIFNQLCSMCWNICNCFWLKA